MLLLLLSFLISIPLKSLGGITGCSRKSSHTTNSSNNSLLMWWRTTWNCQKIHRRSFIAGLDPHDAITYIKELRMYHPPRAKGPLISLLRCIMMLLCGVLLSWVFNSSFWLLNEGYSSMLKNTYKQTYINLFTYISVYPGGNRLIEDVIISHNYYDYLSSVVSSWIKIRLFQSNFFLNLG